MKISMAGEITVAGAYGARIRPKCLCGGGGAVELAPFEHVTDHGGCGAEIEKKVIQWADTKKTGLQKVRFRWVEKPSTRRRSKTA